MPESTFEIRRLSTLSTFYFFGFKHVVGFLFYFVSFKDISHRIFIINDNNSPPHKKSKKQI
jgi:hypothetical protein